jgi:uncharacterized protein with von Willebrand factor type A (vWA) domain
MSFLDTLVARTKSLFGEGVKPTREQAVEADRFDQAYWKDVRHNVKPIDRLVTELSNKHDYVENFMEDLFHAAYKADPKTYDVDEMKPTHVPNQAMVKAIQELPQFQQLRTNTRGDEYGSAMAMLSMSETIKQIQAQTKEAKERAKEQEQAEQEAQEAQDAAQEALAGCQGPQPDPNGEPGGPGQGNGQQHAEQLVQAAEQASQAAANARSQSQAATEQAVAGMKAQVKAAIEQAQQEGDEEQALCSAFGVDDGELQKMSFEERQKLGEKLRNNRLAKFHKLLGQFKMIQQAESRRKIMHATDEVVGVKLGDDLTRMIPAEMLNLASPELEADFWMRYANKEILQYDLRGSEKMGQGPVICVVDESGSMGATDVAGGTREAWSKALALALCDQARQKNRDFHYIGFSSSRQQITISFPGGVAPIAKVIEMTEHFWAGGTEYEAPLKLALKMVEDHYDKNVMTSKGKPDVVFVSDDEYGSMDEDFMREWQRVKDKISLRCFGIAIGCGFSGAMAQISDNVRAIQDLVDSDPKAMADLFRTI